MDMLEPNGMFAHLEDELSEVNCQDSVYRWNGRSTVKIQNLAEHHGHVGQILLLLFKMLEVPEDDQLLALKRGLIHDLPEIVLSDIPYPAHVNYPELSEAYDKAEDSIWETKFSFFEDDCKLSKDLPSWKLVKCADTMDRVMFISMEKKLGNTSPWVDETYSEERQRAIKMLTDLKEHYGSRI